LKLAGQVAIVTGAGRGIGAIALALAREGAGRLAARGAAEIDAVARERQPATGALAIPVDVTDEGAVTALVESVLSRLGRPGHSRDGGGVARFGPVAGSSAADWDRTLAVNLAAPICAAERYCRLAMAQARGTIVNIGSVVTSRTLPARGLHHVEVRPGLSRVLAEEMRPHGVRVGVLSAGAVNTALWIGAEPAGPGADAAP
jgi:3-oxoacyl-[acyl-carrier protein] reductase